MSFFIYRHHHPLSDGRCQVTEDPIDKKPDRPKKDDEEKIIVIPVLPGSSTSTPLFRVTEKEEIYEPCVLTPELSQNLTDSKNLLILNNSTEIDDALLKRKDEPTNDAPKSIKEVGNLSNNNTTRPAQIPNGRSKIIKSIKNIGEGIVDGYLNEYENSQEKKGENHQKADNEISKLKSGVKNQKEILKIKDIVKQNKKNRAYEPDSVSAETKNELNKYLESGSKSKKIIDIIKIIQQNKQHKSIENNNKPNININIFKMTKTNTDDNDSGKKTKHSKTDNQINTSEIYDYESIEKKIELNNKNYNLEKAKSSETVEDKESVERDIEYNNKYHSHKTKNKKDKTNQTKIAETESSGKGIKADNNAKINKIKFLETNVHSESDSTNIENRNKESNQEQKKKIKYHESDSTEKLSGETANDTSNVINENYKELLESVEISNNKKSNYENNYYGRNSDDSDEITIKPADKNDNMQTYGTTLKPKKKKKKDYTYMQGPHTLGHNYLSYEVKYKRRGVEALTTRSTRRDFTKENNVHKIVNNRKNSNLKNYWSVPFNVLTQRQKNVTNS